MKPESSDHTIDTAPFLERRNWSVDFKMSFWYHRLDKNTNKKLTISALDFEKWSKHKTKSLYNVFSTLKSTHNHI